jgi:hypothetical protein
MVSRISFVDEVLGFMFEQGFARKFEEVGSPENDLELWYRNAVTYSKVTSERPVPDLQRVSLVTLIEAIRFEAMCPPPFGEPLEFELSAYEFSEDILVYKSRVIEEVLRQEAKSRSTIDPPKNEKNVH